jgi:hypothetical protein
MARLPQVFCSLALCVLLAACGGGDQDASRRAEAPSTAADATLATDAVPEGSLQVAGMRFAPPPDWLDQGPSGMRQAEFHHPPLEGDEAPAVVAVFYFGPDSGGGVEANLQRWIGQMTVPQGGDPAEAAARSAFEAAGMRAHVVSLDGTYNAGGMGGPMSGDGRPLPGYRLVGVVLEGPQGNIFFKLTGPAATVKAMEEGLLGMVRGAQPAN